MHRLNLLYRAHHTEKTLLGLRFGRLVVIARVRRRGEIRWQCRCDCGQRSLANPSRLQTGRVVSCGCRRREIRDSIGARSTTHGLGGKRVKADEYNSWIALRRRCLDSNNSSFKQYGARGIRVCERWDSFENFLSDIGPRPSPKHSIDRIDVNGHYEPANCRWATSREQCWNKTVTVRVLYRGRAVALSQALFEAENVVKRTTAADRIRRGWDVARAVEVAP